MYRLSLHIQPGYKLTVIGDAEVTETKVKAEEPLESMYHAFEAERHFGVRISTERGKYIAMVHPTYEKF